MDTALLWYRVGRTASIAGSGTDGQVVVGLWVSDRSIAETTGVPGGLASGGGRASMAGRVTRPRTGEAEDAVACEYPDAYHISGRNTDLPLAVIDRVQMGSSRALVVDRASPSPSMGAQYWMERGGAYRNH